MPFYEYECSACKYYTEVLQKISDPPLKKCPSCGKQALKRLVSAPVFRLKGSGWYETDFKSDNEQKRNLVGEAEKEIKEAKETKDGDSKGADSKSTDSKAAETTAKSDAGSTAESKPSKNSKIKSSSKAKTKTPAKKKTKRR